MVDTTVRLDPLTGFTVEQIAAVMRHGEPWLPETTDFWFWRECFGNTSFIASVEGVPAGGILACVSQTRSEELYIDQVAVSLAWRRRGVTRQLLAAVEGEARRRGCRRVWLSTDPMNPALGAWPRLGYEVLPGTQLVNGWPVTRDMKGPGKHRALFEKRLP
jgi:GNAT superfamily N-acetyltransferase